MPYFFIFLFSFLICLILTFLFRKIGNKYHFFDNPKDDELKIHQSLVSYLGGLAMLFTTVSGLLFFALRENLALGMGAVILGSLIIFSLGFWDDLKWKHIFQRKPHLKLSLLVIFPLLSTLILLMAGFKINFFPYIIVSYFLTTFYIFVLINSVNYQDGMDGLAGGLALISLVGFIVLSLIYSNNFALTISLIFCGAVLGFLVFNFPPAKIFMGDSGAYFLGFILSVLAMIFSKPYSFSAFFGPLFILGIPVFEGVFTNLRRIAKGKSILVGDREYFYDRLHLKKGFSMQKTLLIYHLIQVIFIIIGLVIYIYGNSSGKT